MGEIIHVDFKKGPNVPPCECDVCLGMEERREAFPVSLGIGLTVLMILVAIAVLTKL